MLDTVVPVSSDAGEIVTDRALLGSVSRIGVRLSGDVTVKVDHPSTRSRDLVPGPSVRISLPTGEPAPVVTVRR